MCGYTLSCHREGLFIDKAPYYVPTILAVFLLFFLLLPPPPRGMFPVLRVLIDNNGISPLKSMGEIIDIDSPGRISIEYQKRRWKGGSSLIHMHELRYPRGLHEGREEINEGPAS